MDAVLQKFELQSGSAAEILVVPGILAYSQDQTLPLMPVFERFDATVTGINYGGTRFDARRSIDALRQIIETNLANDRKTVPFASSLGGMLMARVLGELRHIYPIHQLQTMISTVIVDSPSGSKDLIVAPFLPGGINPGLGNVLQLFTPSVKANEGYGRKLLDTFRNPPKDGEIELTDDGLTADEIKQAAIRGLSDHDFTVYYDQVRWMLNTTLGLSGLDGLDVTYVACTANNVTVRQPQGRQAWEPHVKRVIEVATPHCAYLQAQPTWTNTLNPLFDSLIATR